MTPKNEMSYDLEFEEQIRNFTPEGQFLARQLSDFSERQVSHAKRISALEKRDNRMLGISGIMSAFVSGVIAYFTPFSPK